MLSPFYLLIGAFLGYFITSGVQMVIVVLLVALYVTYSSRHNHPDSKLICFVALFHFITGVVVGNMFYFFNHDYSHIYNQLSSYVPQVIRDLNWKWFLR